MKKEKEQNPSSLPVRDPSARKDQDLFFVLELREAVGPNRDRDGLFGAVAVDESLFGCRGRVFVFRRRRAAAAAGVDVGRQLRRMFVLLRLFVTAFPCLQLFFWLALGHRRAQQVVFARFRS